jgi:ATP-binding cassette subfamily B protein
VTTTLETLPRTAPPPAGPPAPPGFGALVAPVRGRLLLAAALSALSAVVGLLPFVAVAEIGRLLLAAGTADRGAVWTWAVVGAAGALARILLFGGAGLLSHLADVDVQRHLRTRLARHLGAVPLGWFTERGSGEVKKALEDDVDAMHHMVGHAANDLAAAVAMPVAALVYLVAVDWRMALVTVAVIPLGMLAMASAMRGYGDKMARYEAAQRRLANATVEYVDGIEVVKAFGGDRSARGRFAAAVDEVAEMFERWVGEFRRASAVNNILLSPALVLVVVLGAGTGFVAAGWLDGVDLLPFLLVGVGLPTPYLAIGYGFDALVKARAAARHVGEVLATPPLPEPSSPRTPRGHRVEYVDVGFSYDGSTPVLDGVDAVLEPGTVTALVGPSGSGKTTMARLLPRFWDVTAGAVRLGGLDVRDVPSAELLRRVGVVFQDVRLVRDTVRENIRLGRPHATDAEVEAAARAACVHDVVAALPHGYGTVLGEEGSGLSGGERQRVTIARVILQDAPVVVLDEATAYADPESESAVQAALAELTRGKTVLVIAHRLHTIAAADQILVLDGGRVLERGRHPDLLARGGLYARQWAAQERAREQAVTGTGAPGRLGGPAVETPAASVDPAGPGGPGGPAGPGAAGPRGTGGPAGPAGRAGEGAAVRAEVAR